MGPSGSGKTTLLNMLAGNVKESNSQIYINTKPINTIPYNLVSAYLMQSDIVLSTLTPREAFMFSLNMRTTYSY